MKGAEDDDVENDFVENDEVEEEEDDDVGDDDVEEEDRSQDLGPHFVRACAVELHVNVSHVPLYAEVYGKNATPKNEPRTRTHILCELAQSKRMSRFHTSHFIRKFTGKMPRPRTTAQTLCEPAQSKRMSRFHKSHFMLQKFTGKMPWPRLSPERGHTFCASLRNRNACQDFTTAILYDKFTGKICAPEPRRRLCASLHSRNALQHFTRATFY